MRPRPGSVAAGSQPNRGGGNPRGGDAKLGNLEHVLRQSLSERVAPAVAALLLVVVGAVNLYRAATQSITADEAFTYNHFAGGDEPLRVYDANNHVLFTWLARGSLALFGLSELSLRLPTVLAGWAYLAGVYRLARYLFKPHWLFLPAAAALTLNPFVLDFLSAARGYGLGLALLLWAIYLLTRCLNELEPTLWRVHAAAICLALAAAANLSLVVPGAALAGAFCFLAVWKWPPALGRLGWLAREFAGLGMLLALGILACPLRTARRANFYVGVDTLRQTLEGGIYYSFLHARPEAPSRLQNLLWDICHWLVPAALAVGGLCCGVLVAKALRGGWARLVPLEIFLILLGGTCWGTLALLIVLRHGFEIKYPVDRAAVYWIPLFTLLCLGMIGVLRKRRPAFLAAGLPLTLFLVLAVIQYLAQFNVRYYAQWRYDAGTKDIVNVMRAHQAREGKAAVRVGATWLFEPSLNFYRRRYDLQWLERITRQGPRGQYDYYVLHGEDLRLALEMELEILYRDPISGAVLARPARVLQSAP